MRRTLRFAGVLLVGAWCFGGAVGQQPATQPAQSSAGQTQKTTANPAPRKSTAEENPFPTDLSEKAAEQKQKEQQPTPPDAPGQPPADAAQKPGAGATDNPFPEDVSRRAAAEKSAADAAETSGSGVSSSSSSSSNPDAAADPNGGSDVPRDTGRHRLRKPSHQDLQSGSLAGEGAAKDDTRVGSYYLSDHNYQGAYNRFAEAVRLDPGNVDAIYGLAESAANLHRTDEAVNNYKLYLAAAPDGGHAKSAQKALRELTK